MRAIVAGRRGMTWVLKVAEESEREIITKLVGSIAS
jgi:hypothetical protein